VEQEEATEIPASSNPTGELVGNPVPVAVTEVPIGPFVGESARPVASGRAANPMGFAALITAAAPGPLAETDIDATSIVSTRAVAR
jgi:hypothetical protein